MGQAVDIYFYATQGGAIMPYAKSSFTFSNKFEPSYFRTLADRVYVTGRVCMFFASPTALRPTQRTTNPPNGVRVFNAVDTHIGHFHLTV